MSDSQNVIFGSLANNVAEIVVETDQNQSLTVSGIGAFHDVQPAKLEESSFYQARQQQTENVIGSDRKRGRRAIYDESSLDDILGQLTSKLNTLSTNEDEKKEECTNAFIDVLGCSKSEASFYLESTAWNLESAVMLWLESNTTSSNSGYGNGGSNSRYSYNHIPAPVMSHLSNGYSSYASLNKKYKPREVKIEGLPDEWKAVVNENSGTVQFMHIPTGFLQNNVPAGFADRDDDDEDDECETASRRAVRGGRRGGRASRGDGVVDMTGGDEDEDLDDDLVSDTYDEEEDDADVDTSVTAVDGDVNPYERRRNGGDQQQRRKIYAPKVVNRAVKGDSGALNTSFLQNDSDNGMIDDQHVVSSGENFHQQPLGDDQQSGLGGDGEMNDTSDL